MSATVTPRVGQGPVGPGSFTTLAQGFEQPAVGETVEVFLGSTSFLVEPANGIEMPVFVGGGGGYTCAAILGKTAAMFRNSGSAGNAAQNAIVQGGAGVASAGVPGANAEPTVGVTEAPFQIPAVSLPGAPVPATLTLGSNAFLLPGGNAFVSGTGGQAYLAVQSVSADGIHVTVLNNGQSENSLPGAVIQTNALVVAAGATGPSPIGEVQTLWQDLLSDGQTLHWTISPVFAEKEQGSIVARVEFMEIGASNIGGSITRVLECQCVSGVVTSVLTGVTTGMDFDYSFPSPPANLATALQGCTATLDGSGSAVVLHVARPAGVAVRARATIGITRMPRPTGLYVLSASPNSGPSGGGTLVELAGEGMATLTSVAIGGVSAAIQPGTVSDYAAQILTGSGMAGGLNDVVVTRADQTSVTLHNGFNATNGLVSTITSIVPQFDRLEGGRSFTITGTGFTGLQNVKIGGILVASPAVGGGGTTITGTVPNGLTGGASAGQCDVVVTSSVGNPSTGGTGKFFFLPSGIISCFESSTATSSGGNLTGWTDIVTGSGYSIITASTPPVHAAEVTGPFGPIQSVVFHNGVGFVAYTSSTAYTGIAATVGVIGTRPVAPPASGRLITAYDHTQNVTDANQAGSMVLEESGPATGSAVARNAVVVTSLFAPAVNSVPFVATVRCDGVTGVTSRINGVDLAVVAQTGALGINEYCAGAGIGQGLGRFGAGTENEEHILLAFLANRNFVANDYTVMTAFNSYYYGLLLAA